MESEMREGRGELEENRDLQQHQDKPPDPLISDLINKVQQQRGTSPVQVGAVSGTSASQTCSNFKMKSGWVRAGTCGVQLGSHRGAKWRLECVDALRWNVIKMVDVVVVVENPPPSRVVLPGLRAS
ncbi:unnamed protein product [Pleuronectes platessa]|uniref:Uncharacterized protein n=1 Tax=Pleuronectes platessa TaxID=8262 RepID=A0A9N7U5A1_PLEPL|nr:unnamed protein product [Pleuronectes platessa]